MPPPYRLALNWDGGPHGHSPVPQAMDDFLQKVFAPTAGTAVDALFWCVGEHTATWNSSGGDLEMVGDHGGRTYADAASYTNAENIRQMLDRGERPLRAIIKRGHKLGLAVYASLRMNDNHFDGAQPQDLPTMQHVELTRLRQEHPEWLLGDRTSPWFALSWNMSGERATGTNHHVCISRPSPPPPLAFKTLTRRFCGCRITAQCWRFEPTASRMFGR